MRTTDQLARTTTLLALVLAAATAGAEPVAMITDIQGKVQGDVAAGPPAILASVGNMSTRAFPQNRSNSLVLLAC